jgi:hypothetical protein
MEQKYFIRNIMTSEYLDWYGANVYLTSLKDVSNCLYDTEIEAYDELEKYKNEIE